MRRWVARHEILILILLGGVILRLPSLFEPYWYGDEGIYLTIGQALRWGSQLYAQIHDNKPPFLYLVTAAVGGFQFWFRFVTLFVNIATVAIFWQLAKKWLASPGASVWATVLFVLLTNLPTLEGNVANAELYFLPLTVGAFSWLYSQRSAFVGGLLLGMAALFKMPAILEVGIWPVFWLVTAEKTWLRKSIGLGLGASLPLLASVIYFSSVGTLPRYMIAAGWQNIPYLSSWQVPVSMTTRVVIAIIMAGGLVLWHKAIGRKTLLLSLWWIVTLFAALLSGRPYPHYLLQTTPAIALGIVGLLVGKERERYPLAIVVAIFISSLVVFKFYYYPTWRYYSNFWQFVVGQKSKWEYFETIASGTGRNYQISRLIAEGSGPQDKIFVWGDQPMIYALSRRLPAGRYTTKYHILDFKAQEETLRSLETMRPQYIVSFGLEDDLPGLTSLLRRRYVQVDELDGVAVYRLFDLAAVKFGQ